MYSACLGSTLVNVHSLSCKIFHSKLALTRDADPHFLSISYSYLSDCLLVVLVVG